MKRVLCAALMSGALLVAVPSAAFANDGHRFEHHHHYNCWNHRWGHEHHFDHHFGRSWECDRW